MKSVLPIKTISTHDVPLKCSTKRNNRPLRPLLPYTNIINEFLSNIPRDAFTGQQRKTVGLHVDNVYICDDNLSSIGL